MFSTNTITLIVSIAIIKDGGDSHQDGGIRMRRYRKLKGFAKAMYKKGIKRSLYTTGNYLRKDSRKLRRDARRLR